MSKYRITPEGGVQDTEYNLFIPADINNIEWKKYIEWAAEGNIADPVTEQQLGKVTGSVFSNTIVNGNFDIWQRGYHNELLSDSQYLPDRFKYNISGSMMHSGDRSTNTPTFNESKVSSTYSYMIKCITPVTTLDTNNYAFISQGIEGYFLRGIVGSEARFSFYVKSSKIGIYSVIFTNGSNATYVAEYEIHIADEWQYIEIPIILPDTPDTWKQNSELGLTIMWSLGSGSGVSTDSTHEWLDTVYYGSTNQTNACSHEDITFYLSQVQFIKANKTTRFQTENIDHQISRCQRYYEKSYALELTPGSSIDYCMAMLTMSYDKKKTLGLFFPYKVTKRSIPTMYTWDADGNNNRTTGWDKDWNKSNNIYTGQANISPNTYGFYFIERVNDSKLGVVARHWAANSDF